MADREAMARAHDIFDVIAQEHVERPETDMGRMFGAEGLRVRGKIYAFITSEGVLVVKLPTARIDELVEGGAAERMRMRGSALREWAELVPTTGAECWRSVIDEARSFVQSITPLDSP